MTENPPKKITTMDLITKGSLIAVLISVPTLVAFFAVWTMTGDLISGAVTGFITNFITLGISFKIINKKFTKKQKDDFDL